ncbi:1-acyl-sn-glycerol-3-phosphate acyltransferase alpha-like [Physella acuta]|uniref:1-acyl-sn-glycerol-3-phosphate acyltransferase alpha-like n=1 Tax=Physella acuta TaxID=109671 RepID=UPI0027DC4CB2|nr:1-acyl-sn-glycerol-3-phosphate acyltransferase alpha-like [Physella acuta]
MAVFESIGTCQLVFIVLFLVLPILYQTSSTFKYHFKLFVYYFLVLLIGFAVTIYSLPRPRDTRNHFFVSWCVKAFLRHVAGMEVEIRGQEILKKDETAVIVMNHQSSLDMIPLFMIWPENCVSLAKKELFYAGPFGIGAWMCGTIYIDRLNHQSARKTMEDTADLIKHKKLKVAIFAEGTRNHKGSMLPFKKGAFHLAVAGQVPIIPVVFSSYNNFYSKPDKRFDEGRVILEVLPPISTVGLTTDDVTSLTELTREKMLECFDRISEEAKTF